MRRRRKRKIKLILGAAALILTFAGIFAAVTLLERRETEGTRSPSDERSSYLWSEEDTIDFDGSLYGFDHRIESFLFVGTDNGGNEAGPDLEAHGPMADFLLLMVLDYTDDTYGYLQIDRNTVTDVNILDEEGELLDFGYEQICTAHWYGGSPVINAENTVDAVSVLLGYMENIKGYYVLNMDDINVLNHAAGGVPVTFEEDLTAVDPSFKEGASVTLDDAQAEKFLRARMSVGEGTNEERMARQRQYISGFFDMVEEHSRKKADYYLDLWNALRDVGTTNMNGNSFSRIANMLLKGKSKGVLTLEGEHTVGTILGDGLEHEEFYPEDTSIIDTLTTLYSLIPLQEDLINYGSDEEENLSGDETDTEDWEYLEDETDTEDWEYLEDETDTEDWEYLEDETVTEGWVYPEGETVVRNRDNPKDSN